MTWLGVVILFAACVMAGTTVFWLHHNGWWGKVRKKAGLTLLSATEQAAQDMRDRFRMNETINVHLPTRDSVDPNEVAEVEQAGYRVTYEEDCHGGGT